MVLEGGVPPGEDGLEFDERERNELTVVGLRSIEIHVVEVIEHVQLAPALIHHQQPRFGRLADAFGHRHQVVLVQHLAVHLLEVFVQPRAVGVKASEVAAKVRRIVRERQRLRNEGDDVDAPAGDALVQPEPHDVVDLAANLWRLPIEIRLLGGKDVQVVLAGGLVERPRRSAEERAPVGRRAAVPRRPPHVVVAVRIVPGRARGDEPRMLVRTVIGHQIEHEPQPARLHLREHGVEVGHRAEVGHDRAIVGDVVAVVCVGRLEDRTHPDHVDAELLQVVELARDAAEVADAVTVAVLEAARINLVDDGVLPPALVGGIR